MSYTWQQKNSYMKLTALCTPEPEVASFPKVFPLLFPKIFVKIVGGKVRVYWFLTKSLVNVTRARFLRHIGNNEFDSRGDKIISSVTHRFCKRRTIVFTHACHIAWNRFFLEKREYTVTIIGRHNILGIRPSCRFANC